MAVVCSRNALHQSELFFRYFLFAPQNCEKIFVTPNRGKLIAATNLAWEQNVQHRIPLRCLATLLFDSYVVVIPEARRSWPENMTGEAEANLPVYEG